MRSIARSIRAAFLAVLVLQLSAGPADVPATAPAESRVADRQAYLADVCNLLRANWPKNRTVNIVVHGHSVPSGYAKTPAVHPLDAYPHLLRQGLSEAYPTSVVNVIVTAIGGEASETGAERFARDVLSHRPDVVTIDYALNDRRLGLERAKKAWKSMIEQSLAAHVKVILLTPTADEHAALDDPKDPLNQHAAQIRELAAEYHVGLVDSLEAFKQAIRDGEKLENLMAQVNHPNRKGHELVAKELMRWFAAR